MTANTVPRADVQWLHSFINCTPFGEHAPACDLQRAHDIVTALDAAPAETAPASAEPQPSPAKQWCSDNLEPPGEVCPRCGGLRLPGDNGPYRMLTWFHADKRDDAGLEP